ncbi:MAG: TonB-dependent receptor, partial [Myxococcota bacterium]|nr:TonB-dependent receptor [Myxococcota bacterium]
DEDFRATPDRRYVASALDQMNLSRLQLVLSHGLAVGDHLELKTTFYRHDVSRAWAKVGKFSGGPSLSSILADPSSGQPQVYYRILKGQEESTTDVDQLMLGTNARTFVAQGVQTLSKLHFGGRERSLDIEAGLRLHYDEILRDHSEVAMDMLEGQLADGGGDRVTNTLSLGSTFAIAGHLAAAVGFHGLTVTPGIRVESMKTRMDNQLTGTVAEAGETVPLFGVGLHYGFTDSLGVLAGVHQGFSPVAPGQPDEVASERSLSFELGARYGQPGPKTNVELVGFYSDYSNISGQCSFSAGCSEDQLDDQFNGGAATIYGVEFVAARTFDVTGSLKVPARLMYTFTHATFANNFSSTNPQWGEVSIGDELPYVPTHQGSVQLGLESERWGLSTVATYLDEMRESAGGAEGSDDSEEDLLTDRAVMIDAMGHWKIGEGTQLYLRVENVLNQRPIVSRRPYGARPGKPLMAMTGLKVTF